MLTHISTSIKSRLISLFQPIFPKCFLFASIISYSSSLFLSGLTVSSFQFSGQWVGYSLMLWSIPFGWLCGYYEGYANVVYWISLIFFLQKKWKISALFSGIAVALSLQTFSLLQHGVMVDENGDVGKVKSLDVGFYLWISAFLLIFMTSLIKIFKTINYTSYDGGMSFIQQFRKYH